MISKTKTGITGFDDVFFGGIPKGRAILISGGTGTGKTVLLNAFVYQGATKYDEPGVFVTFEEPPDDIIKNVGSMGWKYGPLIKSKKLVIVDASYDAHTISQLEAGSYDLQPFIERIKYAVKSIKAKRVAIDSIGVLFDKFSDKRAVRSMLFKLYEELKKMGVTTLITTEARDNALSENGVEEYVVDGVVKLNLGLGQQKVVREMTIRKLRGAGYRSGKVEFEITGDGIAVYPKIPVNRYVSKTDFGKRARFGIEKLDQSLGGGIPRSQLCLLSGNTGTGKSILSVQFLNEGLRGGEAGVFVALEEHVDEIKRSARERGLDLGKYEKSGKLKFVSPESLIDISNDKLLYDILHAINETGATRLVLDSVSSLMSATMSEEQVRQFMIQLSAFLKSAGVTCVANYLVDASFGAEAGQLLAGLQTNAMRLSSIVDVIIVMRYVERKQSVKKLLSVLKARGSSHSRDIWEYEIETQGISMKDVYLS